MKKKKISDIKFRIAAALSTACGVGNIKYAPGTFGSLITFPLFLLINYLMLFFKISSLVLFSITYIAVLALLFCAAYWSINIYTSMNKKHDPSEVVIDEVIGQMIAYMIPVLLTLYYFTFIINIEYIDSFSSVIISLVLIIAPFMFFRIFDILKPGLVGFFDEYFRNTTGIIMDDVIAGIYAGCVVSLILSLFFISIGYFY